MQTEIFKNIDTLINMASSTLNIDEINTELISLNKEIDNKKEALDDLKKEMNSHRYFNASSELVDKNIEISLKNKINRLNRKIKDITKTITELIEEETKIHKQIDDLERKLENDHTYLEVIKVKVTNNSSEYYQTILEKESQNIAQLEEELATKKNKHEKVLKELDLNNQALEEVKAQKETEENRLKDITDNLANPNAYIDEDQKREDEKKAQALAQELDKLEKRKLELLTDANMIGADAKELILKKDGNKALNKLKELVTIIKSQPYMDIVNHEELTQQLDKLETERLELASSLESKNYQSKDSKEVNKRIDYIAHEIEVITNDINNYQKQINTLDEFINNTLSLNISVLEEQINNLSHTLDEYHDLLQDKTKSPRTKANIERAIIKKEQEKAILEDILQKYKENLLTKIKTTNDLSAIIAELASELTKYNLEQEDLKAINLTELMTKDILEEEKDKERLKEINEEIKALKNREKYDKSADEIYDEIEMSLANVIKPIEETSIKANSIDNLFEENKNPRLKVIEMIPVHTINTDNGGTYGA